MNSTPKKRSRNLWPHAIISWFVVFASAMAAWTTYAVRQNMDLVRRDYYDEEIRYQSQLDRLNRTTQFKGQILVSFDAPGQQVFLQLPSAHARQRPSGKVSFYRPSDAGLDFEMPLAVDVAGVQRVATTKLRAGLWQVRVQWSVDGQDYFSEQRVVIGSI